jgi:hypothetical protein
VGDSRCKFWILDELVIAMIGYCSKIDIKKKVMKDASMNTCASR